MRLRRGQTIIEMLIALTVIGVGLFAAASLVFSNLNTVERDSDEVVVVNLAREGLELAKQVRDSNWLAGTDFDAGMVDKAVGNYTATLVWDGILPTPAFDFSAKDFKDANTSVVRLTKPEAADFLANQNSAASIVGNATAFKRLIVFHPICDDGVGIISVLDSGACSVKKVGIRVESRMQWLRKDATKSFMLYEDLYDWK